MKRSTIHNVLKLGVSGVAFSLFLSLAIPAPGSGQGRDDRPSRAEMERRFRQQFQATVQRALSLTDEESRAVQQIVDDMQEERRTLAVREFRLQRKLRSDSVLTAAESTAALDELIAIQQEEARLMRVETTRLRGVLSDTKVLALFDLREAMGRRIQNLRRGGGDDRGGDDDRGRGGPDLLESYFDPFPIFEALRH